MVRGCQKRVVFLKNTGSKMFDEAYFIVSDDRAPTGVGQEEMLDEAHRIISETAVVHSCGRVSLKRRLRRAVVPTVAFLCGTLVGGLMLTLVSLAVGS